MYKGLPKQILTISTNTREYTMQDVKNEINECRKMLDAIGYSEVMKNNYTVEWSRAKKTYGTCERLGRRDFLIKINKEFMKSAKPEDFHELIAHELLHSIDNGMDHTGRWKSAADRVNRIYTYPTPISRLGSSKEYRENYLNSQFKHQITCNKCGHTWKWIRHTHLIDSCKNGTAKCSCGSNSFTYTKL